MDADMEAEMFEQLEKSMAMVDKMFAVFRSKEALALVKCLEGSGKAAKSQAQKWTKATTHGAERFAKVREQIKGHQQQQSPSSTMRLARELIDTLLELNEGAAVVYTVMASKAVVEAFREPCFEEFKPFVTKLYTQLAANLKSSSKLIRELVDEVLP